MTYQDAVASLNSFVNYEQARAPQAMRHIRLSRMAALCEQLGDPQRRFRSILVAGTNGKGSICAMLYAMLRHSTLRVGLYTSPHLEHLRERIRVWDGSRPSDASDQISETEFAGVIERLRPAIEAAIRARPEQPPTHFELLTAAAFLHFADCGVDVAVLEVGLGGRLDATNVVEQAVSVIAPIGVDHADILGGTPEAIAKEKAGIIKPRQTVITSAQSKGVERVLRTACDARGVPLLVCGRDLTARIHRHGLDGLELSVTGARGIYESLQVPLLGRHQAHNAALAIGALELLAGRGIPRSLVEQGLARVEWPGRLEVLNEEPLVLLDGAHNPHAAAVLSDALAELCPGRRIHLVLGMSSDKPVEAFGRAIGRLATSVVCTASRHPRALAPSALAQRLAPFVSSRHVIADPFDAYTYVLNCAEPSDVIVVTGSLFFVGELRGPILRCHAQARRVRQQEAVVKEGAACPS